MQWRPQPLGLHQLQLIEKHQLLFQDLAWFFSVPTKECARPNLQIHSDFCQLLITLITCLSRSCHQAAHQQWLYSVISLSLFSHINLSTSYNIMSIQSLSLLQEIIVYSMHHYCQVILCQLCPLSLSNQFVVASTIKLIYWSTSQVNQHSEIESSEF